MSNWAAIGQAASSVIGTVGGMVQGARNRRAQRKENQRQRDWSRDMFDLQNQRDIEFWQMQNAYNDPAAQMQRLKDAGLNPNLVYGSGADAQAGPIATHTAPQPKTAPERYENELAPLADSMFNYLAVKQAQANISRTEAETEATKSHTWNQNFQNNVKMIVGADNYAKAQQWQHDITQLSASKQGAEWDSFIAGSLTDTDGKRYATNDPNSPVAKAIRAGYYHRQVDLENAIKLGDLREAEKILKSWQTNLVRNGVDPNSPWYLKMIFDFLGRGGNQSLNQMLEGDGRTSSSIRVDPQGRIINH